MYMPDYRTFHTTALLSFDRDTENAYITRLNTARAKHLDLVIFAMQLLIFRTVNFNLLNDGDSLIAVSSQCMLCFVHLHNYCRPVRGDLVQPL